MAKKMSFSELINGDKPLLVQFSAVWCGPCQAMIPIVNKAAKTLGDKANVVRIDVDKNQQVSAKYGIRGVPTFIIFRNGKIKWRQSGMQSEQMLINAINDAAK